MRDTTFASTSLFVSPPIRALCSLTRPQAAQIEAALPTLPGNWMLDRHESYDGHLSLLISPQVSDRVGQAVLADEVPTYVVDRDGEGIHLTVQCGDLHDRLGSFATAAELIRALQGIALGLNGRQAPYAA